MPMCLISIVERSAITPQFGVKLFHHHLVGYRACPCELVRNLSLVIAFCELVPNPSRRAEQPCSDLRAPLSHLKREAQNQRAEKNNRNWFRNRCTSQIEGMLRTITQPVRPAKRGN